MKPPPGLARAAACSRPTEHNAIPTITRTAARGPDRRGTGGLDAISNPPPAKRAAPSSRHEQCRAEITAAYASARQI